MIENNRKFDEGLRQLLKYLPAGLEEAGDEIKKTMRAGLAAALQKMDLVSREEYDIQVQLLERLRARVDQLEGQLESVKSSHVSTDKSA